MTAFRCLRDKEHDDVTFDLERIVCGAPAAKEIK